MSDIFEEFVKKRIKAMQKEVEPAILSVLGLGVDLKIRWKMYEPSKPRGIIK